MVRRSDGSQCVKEGRGSAKILYCRGIGGSVHGSKGGSIGACLLVGVGRSGMGMGSGNGLQHGTNGV